MDLAAYFTVIIEGVSRMVKPTIGVQLIVWGRRPETDLLGVLDEVASLEYAGVEMSPSVLQRFKAERRLFADRGLALAGLHLGVGDVKAAETALELLQKLDGRYLLFSGAGGKGNTEEEYRVNSKFLQDVGRKAVEYGVKVCYHNHAVEVINHAMGMKIICRETDPEHVSLCIDTFWVQYGGLSPVDFIRENLNRLAYLHLKDLRDSTFTELGRGIIDFPAVMRLVEPLNLEWAVVEQDRTDKTPKESMAISRKYLREKIGL